MKSCASFSSLVMVTMLCFSSPLLYAEEQSSEELRQRQQLEAINRNNAALDEQNAELRKRIAELEKQTRELEKQARELTPQAMKQSAVTPDDGGEIYYWIAGLIAVMLVVLVGWRSIARRRRA